MLTIEVCSLRDRGEPQERDVPVTRPGKWGNPFTLERHGWGALNLYRDDLRIKIKAALLVSDAPYAIRARMFLRELRDLAGKRLLCACPSDALACHAWILAEEVARLTGAVVVPTPGREPRCRSCHRTAACIGRYETNEGPLEFACDTCCSHGNEDGHCERLPWAPKVSQ